MRRILLILAAVLIGLVAAVTAATAAGPGGAGGATPGGAAPAGAAAVVDYQPGPGVTDANPAVPASVTVTDGTLDQVVLSNPEGRAVEGTLNPERTGWVTTEPLGYGRTYTWSGTAIGTDGGQAPVAGTFDTLTPAQQVRGVLNIAPGRTVGVAAPIEIQFHANVPDRAAVERALSVTTSVPVEGAWGWLPDENGGSRVHWRPQEYWPAGATITVTADLYGVHYGDGRYGVKSLTSTFTIGRAQVVKADVNSHRLVVLRDGREVANYPASYGLPDDPNRVTRSGIHVVTEKHDEQRMTSERYGYDVTVDWAVRISNNGEFVHASEATRAEQGSANVTHGCINLATADAKEYFDSALYGDPVEVTGSSVALAERDGDIWDWTLSWPQWLALSAL